MLTSIQCVSELSGFDCARVTRWAPPPLPFYQPLIDARSVCVAANETEEILQLVTQHDIDAHKQSPPGRALSVPRRARPLDVSCLYGKRASLYIWKLKLGAFFHSVFSLLKD